MNGRYHGVFLLTEDVEAGTNRLNLDMTGDTLGFLVEWDMHAKTEADATYNALLDKTGKSPFDYYGSSPFRVGITQFINYFMVNSNSTFPRILFIFVCKTNNIPLFQRYNCLFFVG